ncbi:MAG: YeeE/YedE family protein [Pseudohongiellaceae bacterium]|nr:YeeE/YedE family protein [Pseudohongiellaceae bacterium]
MIITPNITGGLTGGILIGLSSLCMLLFIGRITGISGILGGILGWNGSNDWSWRASFVIGLVLGAALYRLFLGPLPIEMQAQGPVLILAGLLVGIGTKLGSGCTSGHGVCGIARRSPRSLAATTTFMLVAIATVFITRHLLS